MFGGGGVTPLQCAVEGVLAPPPSLSLSATPVGIPFPPLQLQCAVFFLLRCSQRGHPPLSPFPTFTPRSPPPSSLHAGGAERRAHMPGHALGAVPRHDAHTHLPPPPSMQAVVSDVPTCRGVHYAQSLGMPTLIYPGSKNGGFAGLMPEELVQVWKTECGVWTRGRGAQLLRGEVNVGEEGGVWSVRVRRQGRARFSPTPMPNRQQS